jgi:hypothetical protein
MAGSGHGRHPYRASPEHKRVVPLVADLRFLLYLVGTYSRQSSSLVTTVHQPFEPKRRGRWRSRLALSAKAGAETSSSISTRAGIVAK